MPKKIKKIPPLSSKHKGRKAKLLGDPSMDTQIQAPHPLTAEAFEEMSAADIEAHVKAIQAEFHRLEGWENKARPEQLPPKDGEWFVWLVMAGRGFGKTRTGAETIKSWIMNETYRNVAFVGASIDEVRQVMVEGPSGFLSTLTTLDVKPTYRKSENKIEWPDGRIIRFYSDYNFEKLRGPQFDAIWVDELAKFRNAQDTWDQLMMCLRLGKNPRAIVTTTPRPLPLLEEFLKDPDVRVTRGTTRDNAQNLSYHFLKRLKKRYNNTHLGLQEVEGILLTDRAGALFQRTLIHYGKAPHLAAMKRIVLGVDPALTQNRHSDETGLILAGEDVRQNFWVLGDFSGKYSPQGWVEKILEIYERYEVDRVVVEVNAGGDMIQSMLKAQSPHIRLHTVRARRGKHLRAEPVVALYEQRRVLHARPFEALEQQMCTFEVGKSQGSPDRMDALVWALTDLSMPHRPKPTAWVVGRK